MKLLGINTAGKQLSVCVTIDGKLISRTDYAEQRSHSEKIIQFIEQNLISSNLKLDDLDGICINLGPGSFTGLRVGISTVKGLVFDKPIRVFGYTYFDELAFQGVKNLKLDGNCIVAIDSRKEEFYCAKYEINLLDLKLIDNYKLTNLKELESEFENYNNVLLLNESNYINYFDSQGIKYSSLSSDAFFGCNLVERNSQKYLIKDVENLEPLYLKDFIPNK